MISAKDACGAVSVASRKLTTFALATLSRRARTEAVTFAGHDALNRSILQINSF